MTETTFLFPERFTLLDYRFVQGEGKKGYQTYIYHDPCLSSQEIKDLDEAVTFMTGHQCEEPNVVR